MTDAAGPENSDDPKAEQLKARLDEQLAGATAETFNRVIEVVGNLVVEGLDHVVAWLALVDAGQRIGLSQSVRDRIDDRLSAAIASIKKLKDAASGKTETETKTTGSKKTASALVDLARELFDFALDDHHGLVATPKSGGEPLQGAAFGDQLAAHFHEATGRTPSTQAIRDALRVLVGAAQSEAPPAHHDTWDDIEVESGAKLLDDLAKFVKQYVVLPSDACLHAIALWVLHTWALDSFLVSPRLVFRSAVWQCGKSRALEVLSCICRSSDLSIMPSAPSIFRVTASEQPTWLLDEFDQTLKTNPESVAALTVILNSGYRAAATVARQVKVGDNWETARFPVFTPMAVAGIMRLSDTTQSRSLTIDMKRKLSTEKVSRFRLSRVARSDETVLLRRRCAAWAARNAETMTAAEPKVPAVLDDRAVECWETLKAIAVEAGGRWPKRSDKAALELSGPGRDRGSQSIEMILLTDLRRLWLTQWYDETGSAPTPIERRTLRAFVTTEDICTGLADLEESAWSLHSKVDRGLGSITDVDLAKLLRPFDVRSRQRRVRDSYRLAPDDGLVLSKPRRGYLLNDLTPVWDRVLPPYVEEDVLAEDQQEAG